MLKFLFVVLSVLKCAISDFNHDYYNIKANEDFKDDDYMRINTTSPMNTTLLNQNDYMMKASESLSKIF